MQVISMQKDLRNTKKQSQLNEEVASETESEFIEGDPISEADPETERDIIF